MSTLALLMSPIYGKSFKLFRRHVAPPSSLAGLLASISLSNQKVDIARTSEPGWYGPRSWWPACCLVVALALVPVWIDCLSCFSLGTGWDQSPSSAPFFTAFVTRLTGDLSTGEKRKTDLERSVSLLTPHYPSDHVQVVVQRPLLCLLKSYASASVAPPVTD
jgi:hypothetical protein